MTVESPIIQKLTAFGLMDKEAQFYLSLIREGPLRAGAVASILGISRMEVYRLVKSMVEKGLISVEISKPQRFVANPPQVIIENYLNGMKRKLSVLEGEREGVLNELSKYLSAPQKESEYRFRLVEGKHNAYNLIKKAAEDASTQLDLMMVGDDIPFASLDGVDDVLVASSKRGVKVRLLTEITVRNFESVKPMTEALELRHAKDVQGRILVVDGRECFVSLVMRGERPDEEVGIWTNGLNFVKLLRKNFESAFSVAEPGTYAVKSIETSMGSVTIYNSILGLIKEKLKECRLEVKVSPVIKGKSEQRLEFTMEIQNPKVFDKLLLADLYVSSSDMLDSDAIMPSIFKLLDASPPLKAVIAVPNVEKRAVELCRFFGIQLVAGEPTSAVEEFIRLVRAKVL